MEWQWPADQAFRLLLFCEKRIDEGRERRDRRYLECLIGRRSPLAADVDCVWELRRNRASSATRSLLAGGKSESPALSSCERFRKVRGNLDKVGQGGAGCQWKRFRKKFHRSGREFFFGRGSPQPGSFTAVGGNFFLGRGSPRPGRNYFGKASPHAGRQVLALLTFSRRDRYRD